MGLENGIVLERTDKIISAEDMRDFNEYFSEYFDSNTEYYLCTWCKDYELRRRVIAKLEGNNCKLIDGEYILSLNDLRDIRQVCVDMLLDEDDYNLIHSIETQAYSLCDSLRSLTIFINTCVLFENETGLNIKDFVEIDFYDSY